MYFFSPIQFSQLGHALIALLPYILLFTGSLIAFVTFKKDIAEDKKIQYQYWILGLTVLSIFVSFKKEQFSDEERKNDTRGIYGKLDSSANQLKSTIHTLDSIKIIQLSQIRKSEEIINRSEAAVKLQERTNTKLDRISEPIFPADVTLYLSASFDDASFLDFKNYVTDIKEKNAGRTRFETSEYYFVNDKEYNLFLLDFKDPFQLINQRFSDLFGLYNGCRMFLVQYPVTTIKDFSFYKPFTLISLSSPATPPSISRFSSYGKLTVDFIKRKFFLEWNYLSIEPNTIFKNVRTQIGFNDLSHMSIIFQEDFRDEYYIDSIEIASEVGLERRCVMKITNNKVFMITEHHKRFNYDTSYVLFHKIKPSEIRY